MDEIENYSEKLQILNDILKKGITELCELAKKKNYLEYPYGKNPDPTPLITEEQFVALGGLSSDDSEPVFQYEYGFDPLQFLSEYLIWAHPDSVRTRETNKLIAQQRLTFRANHSIKQLQTQEYLTLLVERFQSGIEWGPFIIPLTMTSVRCVIKPFKAGVIYCQLSTEKNFETIVKTYKIFHYPAAATASTESVFQSSKTFDIQNLLEKKCYYIRAFAIPWDEQTMTIDPKFHISMIEMKENDEKYQSEINFAIEASKFANYNSFWTIADSNFSLFTSHSPVLTDYSIHHQFPYERKSLYKLQFFGQLPLSSLQSRWERIFPKKGNVSGMNNNEEELAALTEEEKEGLALELGVPASTGLLPLYSCFLGDLFDHTFYDQIGSYQQQSSLSLEQLILKYYITQIQVIYNNFSQYSTTANGETLLTVTDNLLKALQSSILIAWRDSNPQSSSLLKLEESIYKQYRHDLKKYQKKYNVEEKNKKSGNKSSGKPSLSSVSSSSTHVPPAPVLKRPPLSPQLEALLQGFPLIHAAELPAVPPPAPTNSKHKVKPDPTIVPLRSPVVEQDTPQSCRMLYRSVMLSGDVQIIILDIRRMQGKASLGCDYLGKEQAEWLQYTLQSSTATWKIICSGKSFGVAANETVTTRREGPVEHPENATMLLGAVSNTDDMIVVPSGSYESVLTDVSSSQLPELEITGADDASINAEVNNAGVIRKEPIKPVQFLIPQSKTTNLITNPVVPSHYENHTNLYDDCEEAFGRSKYSLQHILADYELKFKEQNQSEASVAKEPSVTGSVSTPIPPSTPAPIQDLNGRNTYHHIANQSGIIILSSGIGSHWTIEEEISTPLKTPRTPSSSREAPLIIKTTNITNISDVLLPCYCAAYYHLSSPLNQQFAFLPDNTNNGNDLPISSYRGNPAFCLEIALGTVNSSSWQAYRETQEKGGQYQYLAGIDAYTYYCQLQEASLQITDNSYTFSELYVLPDSALKIAVYSSTLPPPAPQTLGNTPSNGSRSNDNNKVLLYECICTLQSSHESDDHSQESVFMG